MQSNNSTSYLHSFLTYSNSATTKNQDVNLVKSRLIEETLSVYNQSKSVATMCSPADEVAVKRWKRFVDFRCCDRVREIDNSLTSLWSLISCIFYNL